MRGRITLTLHQKMEIPDYIANNAENYFTIALGRGTVRCHALGERIVAPNGLLFKLWELSAPGRVFPWRP